MKISKLIEIARDLEKIFPGNGDPFTEKMAAAYHFDTTGYNYYLNEAYCLLDFMDEFDAEYPLNDEDQLIFDLKYE